jgi:hypothetical protein
LYFGSLFLGANFFSPGSTHTKLRGANSILCSSSSASIISNRTPEDCRHEPRAQVGISHPRSCGCNSVFGDDAAPFAGIDHQTTTFLKEMKIFTFFQRISLLMIRRHQATRSKDFVRFGEIAVSNTTRKVAPSIDLPRDQLLPFWQVQADDHSRPVAHLSPLGER